MSPDNPCGLGEQPIKTPRQQRYQERQYLGQQEDLAGRGVFYLGGWEGRLFVSNCPKDLKPSRELWGRLAAIAKRD